MDNEPRRNEAARNVEITLIQHRLLECAAKGHLNPSAITSGGKVELLMGLETPDTPFVIKKGNTMALSLNLNCTGKTSEKADIIFTASCNMEGVYLVTECPEDGVEIKADVDFWRRHADKLCPVASQYLSDMVIKMGYRPIPIPLSVPEIMPTSLKKRTSIVKSKKTKTEKR